MIGSLDDCAGLRRRYARGPASGQIITSAMIPSDFDKRANKHVFFLLFYMKLRLNQSFKLT